jgi:hypothetical protein
MTIINEINEIPDKIKAKLFPKYLGKGAENLHAAFRSLRYLKELPLKAKIEHEHIAGDGAYSGKIIDVHTESVNGALTPGNMAHILGCKIKIEGESPDVEARFVNQIGRSRTKIAERLGIHRSSKLFGPILPLTPETYKPEVVTRFTHGSAPLKEERVIKTEHLLTVHQAAGAS